jgi:ubiquinone/menaquinone biosynthesis C-methylase UbiE
MGWRRIFRLPISRLKRVGSLWDDRSRQRAHDSLQGWLDSPIVLEHYVQPQVSGLPKVDWLTGAVERLRIPPGGRWLSIGCGSASTEIHAARSGFFSSMTALDVSSGSLAQAREAALQAGVSNIDFSLADLNNLVLPPERYDVVLAIMSLHHVERLEALLEQIEGTLKDTGLFLTNEYVGPRRHQFTDLQLSIATELLEALPDIWRRDGEAGSIKTKASRLSVAEWKAIDPSEGVRSDEILAEVAKRFRFIERHDYGGTILHPMFERIVHNFDYDDPKDVAAIRLVAAFESILMRLGVLPSDFSLIVARKGRRHPSEPPSAISEFPASKDQSFSERRPLPPPSPRCYVDFRRAAHASEVVSGFHPWDVDSRWLGESGELRLRAAAGNLAFLVAAHPGSLLPDGRPLTVRVGLRAREDADEVPLGQLVLDGPGIRERVLSLSDELLNRVLNEEVRITLRPDRTWTPAETLPGSADDRRLSIQVLRIAFEP